MKHEETQNTHHRNTTHGNMKTHNEHTWNRKHKERRKANLNDTQKYHTRKHGNTFKPERIMQQWKTFENIQKIENG